jgi:hypothetical protein
MSGADIRVRAGTLADGRGLTGMTQLQLSPDAPPARPVTRVLLIGHALPAALLEAVLLKRGAPDYLCVDSLDAADWLMRDGFDAALVIAHARQFGSAEEAARWRARNPQTRLLCLPSACDVQALERHVGAELDACMTSNSRDGASLPQNAVFGHGFPSGHASLA